MTQVKMMEWILLNGNQNVNKIICPNKIKKLLSELYPDPDIKILEWKECYGTVFVIFQGSFTGQDKRAITLSQEQCSTDVYEQLEEILND
jgi:hypothetical protein